VEDLIEIEKKRAGKKFGQADAPMRIVHASRLLNQAILVMRMLGWAWKWADYWVENGSSWEPLLEENQVEADMTDAQLKIVRSTPESRCDDARRCRLAAFAAALRNRLYDTDNGFDNNSLDRAIKAVLHTRSLVGPLSIIEIEFLAEWLGRAYRSESRLLGFGSDKIPVVPVPNLTLHVDDRTPKFELGARPLPGKQSIPEPHMYEPAVDEPDDFLKAEVQVDGTPVLLSQKTTKGTNEDVALQSKRMKRTFKETIEPETSKEEESQPPPKRPRRPTHSLEENLRLCGSERKAAVEAVAPSAVRKRGSDVELDERTVDQPPKDWLTLATIAGVVVNGFGLPQADGSPGKRRRGRPGKVQVVTLQVVTEWLPDSCTNDNGGSLSSLVDDSQTKRVVTTSRGAIETRVASEELVKHYGDPLLDAGLVTTTDPEADNTGLSKHDGKDNGPNFSSNATSNEPEVPNSTTAGTSKDGPVVQAVDSKRDVKTDTCIDTAQKDAATTAFKPVADDQVDTAESIDVLLPEGNANISSKPTEEEAEGHVDTAAPDSSTMHEKATDLPSGKRRQYESTLRPTRVVAKKTSSTLPVSSKRWPSRRAATCSSSSEKPRDSVTQEKRSRPRRPILGLAAMDTPDEEKASDSIKHDEAVMPGSDSSSFRGSSEEEDNDDDYEAEDVNLSKNVPEARMIQEGSTKRQTRTSGRVSGSLSSPLTENGENHQLLDRGSLNEKDLPSDKKSRVGRRKSGTSVAQATGKLRSVRSKEHSPSKTRRGVPDPESSYSDNGSNTDDDSTSSIEAHLVQSGKKASNKLARSPRKPKKKTSAELDGGERESDSVTVVAPHPQSRRRSSRLNSEVSLKKSTSAESDLDEDSIPLAVLAQMKTGKSAASMTGKKMPDMKESAKLNGVKTIPSGDELQVDGGASNFGRETEEGLENARDSNPSESENATQVELGSSLPDEGQLQASKIAKRENSSPIVRIREENVELEPNSSKKEERGLCSGNVEDTSLSPIPTGIAKADDQKKDKDDCKEDDKHSPKRQGKRQAKKDLIDMATAIDQENDKVGGKSDDKNSPERKGRRQGKLLAEKDVEVTSPSQKVATSARETDLDNYVDESNPPQKKPPGNARATSVSLGNDRENDDDCKDDKRSSPKRKGRRRGKRLAEKEIFSKKLKERRDPSA
jgi:hypothetical protein